MCARVCVCVCACLRHLCESVHICVCYLFLYFVFVNHCVYCVHMSTCVQVIYNLYIFCGSYTPGGMHMAHTHIRTCICRDLPKATEVERHHIKDQSIFVVLAHF